MRTIETIAQASVEVKRSRFLAYLVPYDAFERYRDGLRSEHPKANHIVYAVRFINEAGQVSERSSDDGEPKGCAGVPALNVLRGEELINVGVLIVRYFGGIKLGTGGMARAYAKAAKTAVAQASLIVYMPTHTFRFTSGYDRVRQIEYDLKRLGITTYERYFQEDGVEWVVTSDKTRLDLLSRNLCV